MDGFPLPSHGLGHAESSGGRRTALGEIHDARPHVSDTRSGKRRALQPLYDSRSFSSTPVDERAPESAGVDVLEHLTRHGTTLKELKEENDRLKGSMAKLRQELDSKASEVSILSADLKYARACMFQPSNTVSQYDNLLQQEKQARASAEEQASRLSLAKATAESRIEALERQLKGAAGGHQQQQRQLVESNESLRQQLAEVQHAAHTEHDRLKASLEGARRRADMERAHAEQLERQLDELTLKYRRLSDKNSKLEAAAAGQLADHAKEKELSSRVEDLELHNARLKDQLQRQEMELQAARRAQSGSESIVIVKERLVAAERQLQGAAALRTAHEEVQLKCSRLGEELKQWQECSKHLPNISKPQDVPSAFAALQGDLLLKSGRVEELQAQQRLMRSDLESARREREEAARQLREKEKEVEETASALARVRPTVAVLTQERARLQSLLDSYKQAPGSGPAGGAGQSVGEMTRQYRLLEAELQQVQALKEQYFSEVQRLVSEVGRLQRTVEVQRGEVGSANSGREAAEAQCAALEREREVLEKQVDMLEERLGRGDFDRSKTKILHFSMNPEAMEWSKREGQRVKELEAENETLRRHLEQASSTAGGTSDGGVAAAEKEAEATVQRQRAEELEKQLTRLKSVVKERMGSLREAVAHLFGYRLTQVSDAKPLDLPGVAATTYSLQPVSLRSDSVLLFRRCSKTGWEIIPNEFSRQHQVEADMFVLRDKNIPAFTANITMQLYNSTTQTQTRA